MKDNSDKTKIKILIVIGIVLILIMIITFMFVKNSSNEEENNVNNSSISNTSSSSSISSSLSNSSSNITTEIELLTDTNTFFALQSVINDYLTDIQDGNNEEVYNKLDTSYISTYNITISNIFNIIDEDYIDIHYYAEEIYYNEGSSVLYYFINGYTIDYSYIGDSTYSENINFLVIIKNGYYMIRPLNSTSDIESVANNYNIKDVTISNGYKISASSISETSKLTTYISKFKNLLYVSPTKAYSMLASTTLNYYGNYEAFLEDRSNIYSSISSNIFAYASEENSNYTKYSIVDANQNEIEIIEYNVMNYKINFK